MSNMTPPPRPKREERCGTCRFFLEVEGHSICRRRAPVVQTNGWRIGTREEIRTQSGFPETGNADWCGEWEALHEQPLEYWATPAGMTFDEYHYAMHGSAAHKCPVCAPTMARVP